MSVLRAYRGLFSNGPLVRLLGGEFVSSIGDWLYLVALLIVVYQVSQDPLILGIVGAARILPYVLLSIPAGIVADRYDRRMVLLVTDVARGAIMLAMAWLVNVNGPLLAIVGLAILATCFSCFFGPTIGAYLPDLVRDEHELGPANSAWSTLDNLAFVIGPAVAALLIGLSGLTLAFLLNAVSFVVIAAVLWRLPSVHGDGAGAPSDASASEVPGASASGAVTTLEAPSSTSATDVPETPTIDRRLLVPLVGLGLIDTVAGFVFGGLGVLTVIIAVNQLHLDEAATGYLNAAVGVGGIIGAVGSSAFVVRSALRLPLVVGGFGLAVGVAALGFSTNLGPALVAMALASAGSLLTEVVSTTIFQRTVPNVIRGRALGAIATIATLSYAAGSLVLPVAAGIVGIDRVLVASAVLVAIGSLVAVAIIGTAGDHGPSAELTTAARRAAELTVFAGVPASRLADAFARAVELDVAAGDVIVRQGDPADRFYVILSGTFVVSQAESPDRPPSELRTMGEDEVFGEIGLLTGSVRTATVTATAHGRLLALDAPEFLALVGSAAEVGPRLLAIHRGGGLTGSS